MAQILVRNLDDRLKVRLRSLARKNGRSMEAEASEILRNALLQDEAPSVGFGTASAALFRDCGLNEPIKELRGFHWEVPDFKS